MYCVPKQHDSHMVNSIQTIFKLIDDFQADCSAVDYFDQKYASNKQKSMGLLRLLLTNIGFQSVAAIRLMHCARDLPLPLGGEVLSRIIRYVYGMEIHWQAQIAPGVTFVHGNGIVISKNAKIGARCLIFHNVTLGESRDPVTAEVGAPTLEENVHVGPGATLVGPINIGRGSKIMAGAVLNHSVPPHSMVKPAQATITKRSNNTPAKEDAL